MGQGPQNLGDFRDHHGGGRSRRGGGGGGGGNARVTLKLGAIKLVSDFDVNQH